MSDSADLAAGVYAELRRVAHHYMRAERAGHTLQTTALVHEAYLRLAGLERMQFRDRAHFVAMAATMMRRVLVDYARAHARDKRGGGVAITSEDASGEAPQPEIDLLALDDALDRLARLNVQQARIVELRFFGGLTIDETARALEISPKTVTRDWAVAKAWLYHELTE